MAQAMPALRHNRHFALQASSVLWIVWIIYWQRPTFRRSQIRLPPCA